MTESEAAIAFNMTPDVGAARLRTLVSHYGSAAAAWEAREKKSGWDGRPVDVAAELEHAKRLHLKVVTIFDDDYPPRLRDLASPPLCLYVAGAVERLQDRAIAMVGTRALSFYGREMAEQLSYGLAMAGWTVVSGLAAGIDAASHRGALMAANGGLTVGVLGGAIDCFYPAENRELGREILRKGGAVVSEFPLGRKPDSRTFPQRNRIVAALSRGVVAVESPLKSGTMITCELAADLGRPVMAVPGPANSRNSAGCHRLIREGAALVASVDDILETISGTGLEARPRKDAPAVQRPVSSVSSTPSSTPSAPAATTDPAPNLQLSIEESAILAAIDETGVSIDAVVERTGLPPANVNTTLVSLRMKHLAKFLPGGRVVRVGS